MTRISTTELRAGIWIREKMGGRRGEGPDAPAGGKEDRRTGEGDTRRNRQRIRSDMVR